MIEPWALKRKPKITKHHIISESVLFLLKSELAEVDISVAVTGTQRYSKVTAGQSGCESKLCEVGGSEPPQQALSLRHLPFLLSMALEVRVPFEISLPVYVIFNSYLVCESMTLICKTEKIIMSRTEVIENKVYK